MLLEQKLERELLLFACRNHIYEMVLRKVFETKIHQVTNSLDITLFKKFKETWKNIDVTKIEIRTTFVKQYFNNADID